MLPPNLKVRYRVQQTFVMAICLLSLASLVTAQSPEEPFHFGKFDLELFEQANLLDKKYDEHGLVYRDAEMNAYLDHIGRSLIKGEEPLENVTWQFRIIRNPTINAFASPNGSIYVHTGLMARVENESQLAAILSHEIIHVRNRHTYKSYRSYRKKSLAVNIIGAATSLTGFGELGMAAQFIMAISVIGYSRELEKEADLDGARLMLASSHDAHSMVGAFECLIDTYEVDLDGEPFYGSHPKTRNRIAYLREFFAKTPAKREEKTTDGNSTDRTNKGKYQLDIARVTQHNISMALDDGLYRTAVRLGKRLIDVQPNAANFTALADAYTGLGPRPFEPTTEEKSKEGKGEARNRRNKLGLHEIDRLLVSTPAGQELQKLNYAEAEKHYRNALNLDSNFATAWRGLGTLFAKRGQPQDAVEAYRKYIELQPAAMDRLLIMKRIQNLETKPAPSDQKQL
jgi:predicted Zn-dependent protease